ncbi:GDP-fucose synthetase [Flavobacterium branchiophilum]|uniref:GDP-L-fucose synthase n=1 Tax=Flavobacterium branchiophilum TaxID=55197 RepID=A0A2H3KI99_9FLAO|nr:GDP-L-fucose synthase [Flavobacterium branchiophilum]OXA80852.1 GDP-fucose synthetase [Flavobacterium branchiophilum] [Flavobacterium branchiophilum NBRC 15030 = ATCC 35035]PDS24222.1 GDP-L-fucose synthase [Flavobacterium branchiophilum]TQM40385.1 GDP-L-fucose synthase [Flavobacterium branchiophilum]GEM54466.1 GDP-L-fucose synthase [Flavobacterium branchiophilum NBRC 15030 = ATCC 35035]
MFTKTAKIFVAGSNGMVGSAIVRNLKAKGFVNIIEKNSKVLDLRNQQQVLDFFESEKPEYVFLAAAKVGGILANNTYPAAFLYDNLMIQNNVIHAAYLNQVKKLLFLGSSCIYPKLAPQPIKETYLLTGSLEPTNEAYAIAKIAGIEMCKFYRKQYGCHFISAMPTNLYGINDNFDLQNSHVLPALLRKFIEAKQNHVPEVSLWGTGKPMREFLFVSDLAEACCFLMEHYESEDTINVGTGTDVTIFELAQIISTIVGYTGNIIFDTTKPDGTPRKLLDVSKINQLGWKAQTSLEEGINITYNWILQNKPF